MKLARIKRFLHDGRTTKHPHYKRFLNHLALPEQKVGQGILWKWSLLNGNQTPFTYYQEINISAQTIFCLELL